MTRLLALALFAMTATTASANVPSFGLPSLVFPDPAPQPDVSTNGCVTATTVLTCE